jgi:hypothetical protein
LGLDFVYSRQLWKGKLVKKNDHVILAVHITDRIKKVPTVQKLLSEYGSYIQTRLGMHETGEAAGLNGVLVLQLVGGEKVGTALAKKLNAIKGIEAKKVVFKH